MSNLLKIAKNSTCIVLILILTVLSSCATRYQREGFAGGYTEIKTGSDQFIVTFNGNSYTTVDKTYKYALRRASEVTLQNGYKYFVITFSTIKEVYKYGIDKPGRTLFIKCYKDKPNDDFVDAEYFLTHNKL